MTPTDLVIIGAGGHGRQLHDLVEAHNAAGRAPYRVLGYLDDRELDDEDRRRLGAEHLGPVAMLAELDAAFAIGVADPAGRKAIAEGPAARGRRAETLCHPTSIVARLATLGPGAFLSAHAVIDTNVHLGADVHVNYGASVGHDSVVGDQVTICPGARVSGAVTVGDGVFLGTNAAIIQGMTIGAGAIIGAGAVVRRDVPPGTTVTGLRQARAAT
jgi:sugar O-acyltransferase (sialic acid O-acetyltransferase NeuD family)